MQKYSRDWMDCIANLKILQKSYLYYCYLSMCLQNELMSWHGTVGMLLPSALLPHFWDRSNPWLSKVRLKLTLMNGWSVRINSSKSIIRRRESVIFGISEMCSGACNDSGHLSVLLLAPCHSQIFRGTTELRRTSLTMTMLLILMMSWTFGWTYVRR